MTRQLSRKARSFPLALALGAAFSISQAQVTVVDSSRSIPFIPPLILTIGPTQWGGPAFTTGTQSVSIRGVSLSVFPYSTGQARLRLYTATVGSSAGNPATLTQVASVLVSLPNSASQQLIALNSAQLGDLASINLSPSSSYALILSTDSATGLELVFRRDQNNQYTFSGGFSSAGTGYVTTPDGGVTWQASNGTPFLALQVVEVQQLPSAAATQQSMVANRDALRSIFVLESSYLNPGLTHDCTTFGSDDYCLAFTGKYASEDRGIDATSGVLTLAFKPSGDWRLGAFLEQRFGDVNSQGVRLRQASPDWGVFGVWNEQPDTLGPQIRVVYREGRKRVDTTRTDTAGADVGFGSSVLDTKGFQLTFSNGFKTSPTTVVKPYAGLRSLQMVRRGYTESNAIGSPLTYGPLSYRATQLLAGVQADVLLATHNKLTASLGFEHDVRRQISHYAASGVAGLGALEFGSAGPKTRPVASFGVTRQLASHQQVTVQVVLRREAWQSASTRTAFVSYSAGF